jgi:hypothetical protein
MNLHGGVDDLPTYVIDVHTASNAFIASRGRHGARYGFFSATPRSPCGSVSKGWL